VKRIHRASISVSLVAVYCGKKSVMTKLKDNAVGWCWFRLFQF